jgi:superkiller protein 3
MLKDIKFHKYTLLAAILLVFAFADTSFAQDLGSSSGLFNAKNPKVKSSAAKAKAKKLVAKKPPAPVATRRTVAKSNGGATRTAQQNLSKAKTQKKSGAAAVSKSVKAPKTGLIETLQVASSTPNSEYNEEFERAIEEGNAARDNREYARAETAYLRAQSVMAKDSRAVYGLGNLYADHQRWEEAERAYRAAIQLDPTGSNAYVALSFVLTQPIAGANLADRYSEAEKTARQAIALDSSNAVAFDQLGVALELVGVIRDETRNAYRKAIELEPNFALAHAHLGRLLRRLGLKHESDAAYHNSIRLAVDVPTMIMVADVMQSQQKYIESEQLLRQALRQDPKNPTALYLLGRALTTHASYEEAEKVLKKSAQASPNPFIAYSLLGSLFLRRENYDDAEKYLMKALQTVSPNEKKRLAQDFESVGDGFASVGKNKSAARVYSQAATLDKEKTTLGEKLAKVRN